MFYKCGKLKSGVFLIFASMFLVNINKSACSDNFEMYLGSVNENDVILNRLGAISCEIKCSQIKYANGSCDCDGNGLQLDLLDNSPKNVQFLCRESEFIIFKTLDSNFTTYLVETKRLNDTTWTFVKRNFVGNGNLKINLIANTKYKFRFWGVTQNGSLCQPIESNFIKTLSPNNTPAEVESVNLVELQFDQNKTNYYAKINWQPSNEFSCHYEFLWYDYQNMGDFTQREVNIPNNFTITLEKLSFNANYSVGVMAKSSDWELESQQTWLHFQTPHCLEVLSSLEYCVPPSPTGLGAKESLSDSNKFLYHVNVSWDEPKIKPDYYTIHLRTYQRAAGSETETFTLNATANEESVLFENIYLRVHFIVILYAYSKIGSSDPAIVEVEIHPQKMIDAIRLEKFEFKVFANVFIAITLLGVISSLIYYKCFYNKSAKASESCSKDLEFNAEYTAKPLISEDYYENKEDKWEINEETLMLENVIGEGAFGVVKNGWLKQQDDKKIAVAVKMLPDEAKQEDFRQFKQEIEIMKCVGKHPNIVSLIGYCKDNRQNLSLIVEFCSKGNLLTFLRNAWQCKASNENLRYENVSSQTWATNKIYMGLPEEDICDLKTQDLLSIARQVALGMEYLASLHVLHRDLAARNVLVCEDGSVKVSDFGLSRDVYKDDVYCKTSCGRLPIRWLALESLTHQIYSTQSDVWSFGILLWEILTLGANPYPGIATQDVLEYLLNGQRMECPGNCSSELYWIMKSCWLANPKERPTFSQIVVSIECILDFMANYMPVNMNTTTRESHCESEPERYVSAFL